MRLLPSINAQEPALPITVTHRPKSFVRLGNKLIKVNLAYSKPSSFGAKAYRMGNKAWAQKELAVRLEQAAISLSKKGYGILILDAYRPFSVTIRFWNYAVRNHLDVRYVAPPWYGSAHNRGAAVDITLYSLKSNQEINMGGKFDSFIPNPNSIPIQLLKAEMGAVGFESYQLEWWHFSLPYCETIPIYDFPL